MSDNKKYYYLKLKEDFFDGDAMIVMESMQDGYKYSNILLKLYLRSLKNEGKLMFNDRIPYNSTILSQVTRHSIGDVERAIKLFKEMDLIEVLDNGAIFISDIQNFVGESSTEGDRKREYRRKIDAEKLLLESNGQMSGQMSDKRPPEIEIELEKELELEIDKRKKNSPAKAEPSTSKKSKNKYGEFNNVLFTNDEYQKLSDKFPDLEKRINNLSFYIESKGAKYKSHYATILSWARRDEVAKPQRAGLPDAPDKFQVKQEDIDAFEQMMGRKVTAEELEAMKGG